MKDTSNALIIPDCIRNADYLAQERISLCANNPECPECGTNQVQIISVSHQEWKCRECKTEFVTDFDI